MKRISIIALLALCIVAAGVAGLRASADDNRGFFFGIGGRGAKTSSTAGNNSSSSSDLRKSAQPRLIQVEEDVWVNLNKDLLRMHDELVKAKTESKVAQAEVSRLKQLSETSAKLTAAGIASAAGKKSEARAPQVHRVQKNECLWKIAMKYYNDGFKWRWLYKANLKQIDDPNYVYPEQIIDIPQY